MMTPQLHDDRRAPETAYTEGTRRLRRRDDAWVGGVVLIVLGGLFLLQNLTGFRMFSNWWALFLFIPAAVMGVKAWNSYRDTGALEPGARDGLLGAMIPLALGVIFLFGLDFGALWPVLLVLAGVSALVAARDRQR